MMKAFLVFECFFCDKYLASTFLLYVSLHDELLY